MKRLILPLLALSAAILGACESTDSEGDKETFSVRFSLPPAPSGLTLDSLEVGIALGDTGKPQAFTVDLKTGTSKAQVLAYPGQSYVLTYALYASGYDIGRGRDSGVLAKDQAIELKPVWDLGKVGSAVAYRERGALLPAYLESAFGLVQAGKPLEIVLDSSAGHVYTWYVRYGDSVIASGAGTHLDWTAVDSLAGKSVNVKLVVKQGDKVIEERDWGVKVLDLLPVDRLQGMITRIDTLGGPGSFTRFTYTAEGKVDSVLTFDTTAFVPGRQPVHALAYTYTKAHHPTGDVAKVVRTARNEAEIDSLFAYDEKGRLAAVTVTVQSGSTADSLAYPADGVVEIRSFALGKPMRRVKRVTLSAGAVVDSIWSNGDSGLVLSGLIRYDSVEAQAVNQRVFRKFTELEPVSSVWTLYNALGKPALRRFYREGSSMYLEASETFAYRGNGLLDRMLRRDEESGELERVQTYVYQAPSAAKSAAWNPGAGRRSGIPEAMRSGLELREGLAQIGRYFPVRGVPQF